MIKDLTQGDIKTALRSLAIPATIGYLFHTLYNVTDTYFAGMISTEALAALSLSFPVFFLLLAVGIGMSEGLSAVVGNALGEGRRDEAVNMSKNGLLLSLIISILVTVIGLLSTDFLMRQLGAEGSYLQSSLDYIDVVILGSFFMIAGMFINALLYAQGDTTSFRNILVVSFFLNIVLDYSFVKMGFGVKGIAYATVATEFISMLYLFYRLNKTPLLGKGFYFDRPFYIHLIKQGLPPTTNMLFMALGVFIITYYAADFGQSIVAMLGIGMRIEQIAIMPIVGINIAVLSMVSQNSGAAQYERIRSIIKAALGYSLYVSIIAFVVLMLVPGQLVALFSSDPSVISEGIVFLRIEAFIVFAFAVIFIFVALLQGIERPNFIFYLSLARQIVLPLILLEIITRLTNDVIYVWLSIAFSVVLAAVVVWLYARSELLKKELSHASQNVDNREVV